MIRRDNAFSVRRGGDGNVEKLRQLPEFGGRFGKDGPMTGNDAGFVRAQKQVQCLCNEFRTPRAP